jgi:chromosome segregation ATPase
MFRNRVSLFSVLMADAVICLAVHASLAYPQDTSAPTSTATPQTSPAPGAAQAPAKAQSLVPAVQAEDKKKPKKVWTNDEIKSVKNGVSVVGDTNKNSARHSYVREDDQENENQDLHKQQVGKCRNQIRELRDRIDAVDKRLAQLRDFKADNTSASGGINMHQGYNMVPLADQVKQLEDAKKQLQAQIQDIEYEAQKNGIEPGELR